MVWSEISRRCHSARHARFHGRSGDRAGLLQMEVRKSARHRRCCGSRPALIVVLRGAYRVLSSSAIRPFVQLKPTIIYERVRRGWLAADRLCAAWQGPGAAHPARSRVRGAGRRRLAPNCRATGRSSSSRLAALNEGWRYFYNVETGGFEGRWLWAKFWTVHAPDLPCSQASLQHDLMFTFAENMGWRRRRRYDVSDGRGPPTGV